MDKRSIAAKKGWATRRRRAEFRASPLGQSVLQAYEALDGYGATLKNLVREDLEFASGATWPKIGSVIKLKRPQPFITEPS